jgi:peptide/nickel transport system permease protein
MLRHVLPHVIDVWLIVATLQLGNVILLEASLGFLGVGVPPPFPSWGQMTAAGREYLHEATWIAIAPATALTGVIMAFNIVGDWLRDRLDPNDRNAL